MSPEQEKSQLDGPLEPFLTEQNWRDTFQNRYEGIFSQSLSLNRPLIEKALDIGRIEGSVFFSNCQDMRLRTPSVIPDKRRKKGKASWHNNPDDQNPILTVEPISHGWAMGVNDQELFRLTPSTLRIEEREGFFARVLSRNLARGLGKCIVKEKLSGIKDPHFRAKWVSSLVTTSVGVPAELLFDGSIQPLDIPGMIALSLGLNGARNTFFRNSPGIRSNVDSHFERIMPSVEIDKVVHALYFLTRNSQKLIQVSKK